MAADPRNTGPQTYISSLTVPEDAVSSGLAKTADGPLFIGNVLVKTAIVFPDGTTQSSAPAISSDAINGGTF